ncbi:MAG: porin [Planctomycetaceae bacterium]
MTLVLLAALAAIGPAGARGDEPILPPAAPSDMDACVRQLEELRREVGETAALRRQVEDLQAKVGRLEGAASTGDAEDAAVAEVEMPREMVAGVPPVLPRNSLLGSYNYNFGGGYMSLKTRDGNFSFNVQNQMTADGTFYNLQDAATIEKGFNIPFYRLYFYGNLLKNWEYQMSLQQSLGSFNVLDMFVGYKFSDALNVRVGHFLTPFLYEYYAFSPAWETVITNSPLFQLAGKRQTGAMLWGRPFDNAVQYQVGAFNGADGAYFDIDRYVDCIASLAWTPFKPYGDPTFEGLGCGINVQNGVQRYNLASGTQYNFPFGNGEPTLNQNFVNSTGIQFFRYQDTVWSNGNRMKVAPQVFWFGRFSVLAEYVHWDRALTSGGTNIAETIDAYYVNTSYFLTGERYKSDGLLGYTTIDPLNKRLGAWELAFQVSQMQLGQSSLTPGFATPGLNATRLDQVMGGVNWWANRYVRVSLDYMADWTNRPVVVGVPDINGHSQMASSYGTWWGRVAAFF